MRRTSSSLVAAGVKQMRLYLVSRHQPGQQHASFFVAVRLSKYLLDASERVGKEFCRVTRGHGQWHGHRIVILWLVVKRIGPQKDGQDTRAQAFPP